MPMFLTRLLLGCLLLWSLGSTAVHAENKVLALEYAPAPIDNPLKGLVPYARAMRDAFPHSMEFRYIALAELVTAPNQYHWQPLDALLDEVAQRGHQTIFRVYLEYPGKPSGIPHFLLEQNLKTTTWSRANTPPKPPVDVITPDYNNPALRTTLQQFIQALGQRYDGDPRIGFITAGLLGLWGEWHNYPHNDLFANKTVQQEVMDAYSTAFHKTPILLRYPAGETDLVYANNTKSAFGYHDDSFAWNTLDTRAHYFLALQRQAGAAAQSQWQRHPIGGEIRPEAWGKVFDSPPEDPRIQDFAQCVEATHVTWLMDSGLFQGKPTASRINKAMQSVRRMGYEYQITQVSYSEPSQGQLTIQSTLLNRGVAPFYYDWPSEYALLDHQGHIAATFPGQGKLTGLQPEASRIWRDSWPIPQIQSGQYTLLLQVRNPMPTGQPLRFANYSQDQDLPGWLTLGQITILNNPDTETKPK